LIFRPHRCSVRRCFSPGPLLHAILVDGMIERIEGDPGIADKEVNKWRKAGHVSDYLFAARSDEEFERKKQTATKVLTAPTKKP